MEEAMRYSIGGKDYRQQPLVLGQLDLLLPLIRDIRIDDANTVTAILSALGEKMPDVLAVVLTVEAGADVCTQMASDARADRADYLRWHIDFATTVRVVEDFFGCNRASSLFERMTGMVRTIREKTAEMLDGSNGSSTASAPETSPVDPGSSGESPSA